jgi:hypothetical protein
MKFLKEAAAIKEAAHGKIIIVMPQLGARVKRSSAQKKFSSGTASHTLLGP